MARFCTSCGTPLADETARFCTKCGAAVAAPPNSSIRSSAPKPVVAGILAGLFPFGVGAVYVGQYGKGWMYTIISFGLTFGMSRRSPIGTICGVVYVFYYLWQIIDAVRAAKAMRSAGGITNISTMKRATIGAGMFLALVALGITRVTIEDWLGKTKSVEAAADRTAVPPSTSADPSYTNPKSGSDMFTLDVHTQSGPKVTVAMTFMGLAGGMPRSQVDAALQGLHYRPLSCKQEPDHVELTCTTESQGHQFEALWFLHGRFSGFRFRYPANERDVLYQTFVNRFGQPTEYAKKKAAELFTWESERTIPCSADEEKQCPAIALMFAPPDPDSGETSGTLIFSYYPLVSAAIRENARQMVEVAH